MNNAALQAWVWVLIYGGLLAACLGLFVRRRDADLGLSLLGLGAGLVVVGVVLIFVRARRGR